MGEYGSEFVNFLEQPLVRGLAASSPVVSALQGVISSPRPLTIYFAPRNQAPTPAIMGPERTQPAGYVIAVPRSGDPSSLETFHFPDGVVRHVLVIPEHITLWFAPGAFLELRGNVAVVIRGGIRAGSQMIFSLPEVSDLRSDLLTPAGDIRNVQAVVRLETTLIEEVRPEWFGARSQDASAGPSASDAPANSRALQACIHAACRDRTREGVSLPPLTVVCEGVYCIHETMRAEPTIFGCGALWLRGTGDTSTRSSGFPAIRRFPIGAPTNNHDLPLDRWRDVAEAEDSALLWVHPRVSLDVDGVGLRCEAFLRRTAPTDRYDVEHCVRVAGEYEGVGPLASRTVTFDRCGLSGGRQSILSVDDDALVMRRAPGTLPLTATAIADLQLLPWKVDGQFPPWEVIGQVPPTRYASRLGIQVRLDGCTLDGVISPGTGADPRTALPVRSSRRMIQVAFASSSMLSVTGGKIHQSPGSALGATIQSDDVRSGILAPGARRSGILDLEAGLHIRGGLTLVRSVTFHLAEGPRPSRPPAEADLPDGQDIWIDTGPSGQTGSHLTVMLVDSQSWWFLGGKRLQGESTGAVSLLNVGANDVNLVEIVRELDPLDPENPPNSLNEAYRRSGAGARIRGRAYDVETLFHPPSIGWPGGLVPLLLEGCFFDRYCTTPDNVGGMIVNVGSAFRLPIDRPAVNWFPPSVIPRRQSAQESLYGELSPALAGRSIPVDLRAPASALVSFYPWELVGRSILNGG